MKTSERLSRIWKGNRRTRLSPSQIIALAFAAIIALGTVLLCLPIASRSGQSCGFRPALFTATSATCVTGLVLYDTWSQWSGFGQAVILCMIEIGGLGFMSAASFVLFVLRRKVGLRQRMVIAQALSLNEIEGAVRLQRSVLLISLILETGGALILTLRFWPAYGFTRALRWGVFHAVSAYCNAGFDILGALEPGSSMMLFQNDPVVLLTLSALIIMGGLGFFVWEEILGGKKIKQFSVYTKLVLLMTGCLLLGGTVLFCVLEWSNPGTLAGMSIPQKILNGFFQSTTVRTAGFAAVDQNLLTNAGKGLAIVLMMIGGSSGSTAGGVKSVTVVVLLLFMVSRSRGKNTVSVFRHTIPEGKVLDAMTIISIMFGLALFGGIFISATSPVAFTDALFEAVSALATVGLTAGTTEKLSVVSQILIIIYMYFGRVGVLTISMGFLAGNRAEERFRYAYTNLLIG